MQSVHRIKSYVNHILIIFSPEFKWHIQWNWIYI